MLWSSHNSLKAICDKLCDPDFAKERESIERRKQKASDSNSGGLDSYMPKSAVTPEFGQTLSPMLSERTGFDRILHEISRRHRDYIQSDEARQHSNVPAGSLAFLHPAFSVETKLDGERFLIHISKEGVVKMHTRTSNWYR